MNNVSLSGIIRSSVRCTYTQTGACRASFILSVRRLASARGQPTSENMIRIVAWDEAGESARDGSPGDRIEVVGYLDTWADRSGQWQTEVKAVNIIFPDRREPVPIKEAKK